MVLAWNLVLRNVKQLALAPSDSGGTAAPFVRPAKGRGCPTQFGSFFTTAALK